MEFKGDYQRFIYNYNFSVMYHNLRMLSLISSFQYFHHSLTGILSYTKNVVQLDVSFDHNITLNLLLVIDIRYYDGTTSSRSSIFYAILHTSLVNQIVKDVFTAFRCITLGSTMKYLLTAIGNEWDENCLDFTIDCSYSTGGLEIRALHLAPELRFFTIEILPCSSKLSVQDTQVGAVVAQRC